MRITRHPYYQTPTRRWNIRASEPRKIGKTEVGCAAAGAGIIATGLVCSGVLRWVLIVTGIQFFAPLIGAFIRRQNGNGR